MAESLLTDVSADDSSEVIPEYFCDPCYESNGEVKPVKGYCFDCEDNLCVGCFTYHLRPKPFKHYIHHRLIEKSTKPMKMPKPQTLVVDNANLCSEHLGEPIEYFCILHQKLCCKVCHMIRHKSCDTEKTYKAAVNTKDSTKLKSIVKELVELRKIYNEHLNKAGLHKILIRKNHTNAINDMMKLRQKFDKLMTETKIQADAVKEEDFKRLETVSRTCNIVIEQIDKTTSNLDSLKDTDDGQNLFISMHQAECQLKALELSLPELDNDNAVKEYNFEPDQKLKAMLKDLKILGNLCFAKEKYKAIETNMNVAISTQMEKMPVYEKDINVKSEYDMEFYMLGLVELSKNKILITDLQNKKVKLINTHQNKITAEIQLSGKPMDITTMTADNVALIQNFPHEILTLNVPNDKLTFGRNIAVKGQCKGIAYNAKDQTFIVTFVKPGKVEIIDMVGTVLRSIEKDSKGAELFGQLFHVALSPDRSGVYVSDWRKQSVILMATSGEIKAVYKDSQLVSPAGICVAKSGLVYVACYISNTVHQIDPNSGEIKLILDQKDGLVKPRAISFCDMEDKLYVGLENSHIVKVFNMK